MHPHTSPRLTGVPILKPNANGPEYSRWRRSVKFALETKGTWKYCNGACPMPMPEAGPPLSPSTASNKKTEMQPSLLEERRAWVRHDREVKLDIFLSLAEEVMQEVFEVGPPLPPSNYNAQEMLEVLNERFTAFTFTEYHHTFCHFLNLHIDQYASITEFNNEFSAILEDLLDHGHPLSNTQACSAYFSKLRCTQNPWVAKRLAEWDAQFSEPEIYDIMQESPPWSCIRPLATKCSQNFHVESIPEERVEDNPGHSDSNVAPGLSDASTASSRISHSRRDSSTTAHSQEITVHVSSEDMAEVDPMALRKELEKLAATIPERLGSRAFTSSTTESEDEKWINAKKSITQMALLSRTDRPLPPLTLQVYNKTYTETRAQPESSRCPITVLKNLSQTILTVPTPSVQPSTSNPTCIPVAHLSQLQLEIAHETLRSKKPESGSTPRLLMEHPAFKVNASLSAEQLPSDTHPALRSTTPRPTTAITSSIEPIRTVFPTFQMPDYGTPASNLAVPWPSTPDVETQRPDPSKSAFPMPRTQEKEEEEEKEEKEKEGPEHLPSSPKDVDQKPPPSVHEPHQPPSSSYNTTTPPPTIFYQTQTTNSATSSTLSLPLQGLQDSAWHYRYEDSEFPHLQARKHISLTTISPAREIPWQNVTSTAVPPSQFRGKATKVKTPIFENFVIPSTLPFLSGTPPPSPPPLPLPLSSISLPNSRPTTSQRSSASGKPGRHSKSASLDWVARTRGERDSGFAFGEKARERNKDGGREKNKGWSIGINLARFSHHKGVREII